jgi:hypothetical protein
MTKPDQRETAAHAVGSPLDCGVGRPVPERVQLSRRPGWRMPPNTVSVARPSAWPRWGLMLAGEFLELPISARPTLEKESGSWDTPCKGDAHPRAYKRTKPYNGPGQEHLQSQAYKRLTPNCVEGGKLNPEWVEWLMGWPMGWTGLQPLETARFQEWQRLHSRCWPAA